MIVALCFGLSSIMNSGVLSCLNRTLMSELKRQLIIGHFVMPIVETGSRSLEAGKKNESLAPKPSPEFNLSMGVK